MPDFCLTFLFYMGGMDNGSEAKKQLFSFNIYKLQAKNLVIYLPNYLSIYLFFLSIY